MEAIFVTCLGAVVATMVMTSLMYALVWDGFGHGDAIRALGSEATDKPRSFFSAGVLLYLGSGIFVSWIYWIAYRFFNFDSVVTALFLGSGLGFVQGFLFMHFYVAELGLHHPFAQFSKHWLPLPFAHWVCHLFFGASIGSMLGSFIIHGFQAFAISVLLNLALAGLILGFAKKGPILEILRKRHETSP